MHSIYMVLTDEGLKTSFQIKDFLRSCMKSVFSILVEIHHPKFCDDLGQPLSTISITYSSVISNFCSYYTREKIMFSFYYNITLYGKQAPAIWLHILHGKHTVKFIK